MEIKFNNFKPSGKIDIPCSKSYAHRALIAAFIANKGAVIELNQLSDDILTTLDCLKKLGGNFVLEENKIIFKSRKKCSKEVTLNVKESGSTLRFLLPLSAYICEKVILIGSERLFKRPLKVYLEYFNKYDVDYKMEKDRLIINQKLPLYDLQIEDTSSSQFITGWLFLIAYSNAKNTVVYPTNIGSKEYIDITLDVLDDFGIKFENKVETIYLKETNCQFINYKIEKDWSQAAFFLALGALQGEVLIENININSKQGDKKILNILSKMGAKIDYLDNDIKVTSNALNGIEINIDDCIDLGPIIFVVAAFCKGTSIIKGYQRLEFKESKRATAMISELKKCGVDITMDSEKIIIKGASSYNVDVLFDSYFDHRVAMALSVFATLNKGTTLIKDYECINKSYPCFYEHLLSLNTKTKTNN